LLANAPLKKEALARGEALEGQNAIANAAIQKTAFLDCFVAFRFAVLAEKAPRNDGENTATILCYGENP